MQDFKTLFLLLIIFIVLYIVFFIVIVNRRATKLEKKFSNFALSNKSENESFLDNVSSTFWSIIRLISRLFSKSRLLSSHSKSFDKYLNSDENIIKSIDLITIKILLSFVVFILTFTLAIFDFVDISYIAILFITFLIYFLPNFILDFRFNKKREAVIIDILDAIKIINLYLNKGENIYTSLKMVEVKLDGPISDEFKKLNQDIDYGLTVEEAFSRLDKRLNLHVTKFIANTIHVFDIKGIEYKEVFSYIENVVSANLTAKKEVDIVTIGAKILVMFILIISFVGGFILVINPDYIKSLLETPYGLFIFISIVSLTSSYGFISYKILEADL